MEPYEPTQAVVQPPGEFDYNNSKPTAYDAPTPYATNDEPVQYARPVEPVQHVQMVDPAHMAPPAAPVQYVQSADPAGMPVASGPVMHSFWPGRAIYLALSVLETLLVIRIFLKLLAANPDAGFSTLIYSLTTPFVLPFEGVFPEPQARGSIFDLAALLAIIIYPVVVWLILRIMQLTRRPSGMAR